LLTAILTGQENDVREDAMRRLKACSLEDDFRDWAENYGCCAIPFQHFDMTYNVMKRQRETIDHGLPEAAPVSEFYTWCKKVYNNISSALGEQDNFFQKSCAARFQKTFDDNPFILQFKAQETNREFRDCLTLLAKRLVTELSDVKRELLLKRY
jgi:hypothetical protein